MREEFELFRRLLEVQYQNGETETVFPSEKTSVTKKRKDDDIHHR